MDTKRLNDTLSSSPLAEECSSELTSTLSASEYVAQPDKGMCFLREHMAFIEINQRTIVMDIRNMSYEQLESLLNDSSYEELLREFEGDFTSYFNDAQDDVEVAGMTFYAAEVLKACDPIAYREEFLAYLDGLLRDAEDKAYE